MPFALRPAQYLGIQVVRALLTARHATGPILCVCFTNHALDAFLMGLVSAGVDGIVRAGGRSREEALKPHCVREVVQVRNALKSSPIC